MKFLIVLILLSAAAQYPQNRIKISIQDSETKETLAGATVYIDTLKIGAISDKNGSAEITNIPCGFYELTVKYLGYETGKAVMFFPRPGNQKDTTVFLKSDIQRYKDDIVIYSARNNGVLNTTPMRIEVLGEEEVNEELTMRPDNISKLLGETSGIQVQQTSAVSGNVTFRLMGLPGGYTQLLKDGFPVFSGFSSGLSLLQIPPLDLQQVEVIKGSLSTLYGNGPLAGVVNLISKQPTKFQSLNFILNQTSRKGTDIGTYYSNSFGNLGLTILANQSFQSPVDVSGSGFADIPGYSQTSISPKLFYTENSISLMFGVSVFLENRKGGDIYAIQNGQDSIHNYIEEIKSNRYYSVFSLTKTFENESRINFKNSVSYFKNNISFKGTNYYGRQNYIYSELTYLTSAGNHVLVSGITSTQDKFHSDSLAEYSLNTAGVFVQDDWNAGGSLIIQPGLRYDFINNYNSYFLPHLSLLYKEGKQLSFRIGGGYGYRIPVPDLKAEKSVSLNFDFNYVAYVDEIVVTWNQAFFYTNVKNPSFNSDLNIPVNSDPINVRGFDTNFIISMDETSLFIDYSWNDTHLNLTPRHKLNLTLTIEEEKEWKGGIEAFYTGRQYVNSSRLTRDFWIFGVMVEKIFPVFSITANVENIFNVRQTKWERIVNPPYDNPVFSPIWGPTEGLSANLAIQVHI